MDQWKAKAEEKGLNTKCPWCKRYVARSLPKGMFTHCNDCNRDVVLIATGEQAFKAEDTEDRIPWPPKGTPEYDQFMADREADRGLGTRGAGDAILKVEDNRKSPGPDIFKDPLFDENKKFFDGIFGDSPFMKSGPDDDD